MYTVFGDMSQVQLVGQCVPHWSLQPPFFMLTSRPAMKRLRWVMWLGGEAGHGHTKAPPPWALQDRRHFVVNGRHRHPPLSFPYMRQWLIWGPRGGAQTSRHPDHEALLTGDICAAFFVAAGVHCNTQLVGPGAKWLAGKPQGAASTDPSSGPPVALKLAKPTFSIQEQQLSTAQVWKRLWNHVGQKTDRVFCYFAWTTRGKTPKSQMWSSWVKCIQRFAQQLGASWGLLLFLPKRVFY